jgi:hypothetical protein
MGGGRLGLAELLATKICTLALTVRLFSKPFHVLKICMIFHRDWGPYAHWGQTTIGYHKNLFFLISCEDSTQRILNFSYEKMKVIVSDW